ncbi:MAG: DUF805 domain-containing protein [Pseudomonadota bacterium]
MSTEQDRVHPSGPAEAIGLCLARFLDFSGRAGRPEFWWFFAALAVATVLMVQLDAALGLQSIGTVLEHSRPQASVTPLFEYRLPGPIASIFLMVALLPFLAAGTRRLHDRGMSGWWLLGLMLPVAGWVVLATFMALGGQEADNAFGAPPMPNRG